MNSVTEEEEGYVTVEEEEEEANSSFDSQAANVSTENVTTHLRDLEISPYRNNSGSSSDHNTTIFNEEDELDKMDDVYPEEGADLPDSHIHKNGHGSDFTIPLNPAYEPIEEGKVNGKCIHNVTLSVDINYDYSAVKNTGYLFNLNVKRMESGPIELEIINEGQGDHMPSDLSGYQADVSKTISSACSSTYIPPPASHLTRMSHVSSTSGSSYEGALVPYNPKRAQKAASLNKKRIDSLKKRWENSEMLYIILDFLEKYSPQMMGMGDGFVPKVELSVVDEDIKGKKPRSAKASKRRNTSADESEAKRTKTEPKYPEFTIGTTVFAKWHDNKYYAGKVLSKVSNSKWLIEFYDGKQKNVGSKQIIENYLHLVFGRRVMLMKDEKTRPSPALIVDCRVIKDEPMLLAVTNHGDYHVPISQVYFTDQHIRQVKAESEDGTQKSPTKHNRVTRSQVKTSSPIPCTSGFKSNFRSGSSSELEEVPLDPQIPSPSVYVSGCEPEVLFYTPAPESGIKLKNISGKIPKTSTEVDDNIVGPIIRGDWFKGMSFLLTCSNRCIETNVTDETTDNEDYQFTTVPFVHDRLELQIKLGGGKIYSSVDDVRKTDYGNTYLIAPKPCLTTKYVECLAFGITPVCHEWIVNCCKQQRKLPLQHIPLGWCVENQKFINEYQRKKGPALRGMKILIAYMSDRRFYDFWSKICTISGAIVSRYSGEYANIDTVLVESGMRDDNLATAAVNGVRLVSTTWVIQSLIHGKSRGADSHPMYHPNYEEFDAL